MLFCNTSLSNVSSALGGTLVLPDISFTTFFTPSSFGMSVYSDLMSAVMMNVCGVAGMSFRRSVSSLLFLM